MDDGKELTRTMMTANNQHMEITHKRDGCGQRNTHFPGGGGGGGEESVFLCLAPPPSPHSLPPKTTTLSDQWPPSVEIAQIWLKTHTTPGERVWMDITPNVLLSSNLRPASRIQLTFIFMNSDDSPTRFSGILIDDLKTTRPRFIVLPADVGAYVHHQVTHVSELARIPTRRENFTRAWIRIESFVQSNYEPVERIGNEMIWRRQ